MDDLYQRDMSFSIRAADVALTTVRKGRLSFPLSFFALFLFKYIYTRAITDGRHIYMYKRYPSLLGWRSSYRSGEDDVLFLIDPPS